MVLPDVNKVTLLFREAIPTQGRQRFDETITSALPGSLAYQNAAALVKRQAGDAALARVIRRAVLTAVEEIDDAQAAEYAKDINRCKELVKTGEWKIPEGYTDLAHFYNSLQGSLRGPIITTNFDPLIEIAFRKVGIRATAVPVSLDSAPTIEQLNEYAESAVPIIHVHGYWTSNATLNTIPQLTKKRPSLAGLLRGLFRTSAVLVFAYGGWEDAFMQSLAGLADESDLLGSEIIWAAYEADAATVLKNRILNQLDGTPGFTLYLGIDAQELFRLDLPENENDIQEISSPYAYTRLPVYSKVGHYDPLPFAEGTQPTWLDSISGRWPKLNSTHELRSQLDYWINLGGGGGAVAIGPVGEGKSLALRQVALDVSREYRDWTVLWREPGAPTISNQWLSTALADYGKIIVCIDDADLIGHELISSTETWMKRGSGIVFLLASHDRLWWTYGTRLKAIQDVLFHGMTSAEASSISAAWAEKGLLPKGNSKDNTIAEYAHRLYVSSQTMFEGQHATLFGAILDVRYGKGLRHRVEDLVAKLSECLVQDDCSLGDIFGGICILQETFDKHGALNGGASRPVIAAMAGLGTVFADGKILQLLGREAAITYSGDRVYSRHPAIARAAVQHLKACNRSPAVCRIVGRAGGRLRNADGAHGELYRNAYLLCQGLTDRDEALAAAQGAVEGAPGLLEPKVTLLSTLRRFEIDRSSRYAIGLAKHLDEYRDYGFAVRAYLVEHSIVARSQGEVYLGMGLAALALHDSVGFMLDAQRAGYALTSLAKSALRVREQSATSSSTIPESTYVLMERVRGPEQAEELLGKYVRRTSEIQEARNLSSEAICRKIGPMLSRAALNAIEVTALNFEFNGLISLNDLQRLGSQKSRVQ